MKCEYIVVKTFCLLVAFLGTAKGDPCYRAQFSEDVWPCPDFDNAVMKCDPLELGAVEGKDGELGLQGEIWLGSEIDDGTTMNVEIWKIIDIGKEYLYHAQGDICGSIKDTTAPWYPMTDAMNIKECPIAAKTYPIKDMIINLSAAKDLLNHEMCGEYLVEMSITKDLKKTSCHQLGVAVNEFKCEKSE